LIPRGLYITNVCMTHQQKNFDMDPYNLYTLDPKPESLNPKP